MNWYADQARRITAATGVDPIVLTEAARKALPDATQEVSQTWAALLDDPGNEVLRQKHQQAAILHCALKELAE